MLGLCDCCVIVRSRQQRATVRQVSEVCCCSSGGFRFEIFCLHIWFRLWSHITCALIGWKFWTGGFVFTTTDDLILFCGSAWGALTGHSRITFYNFRKESDLNQLFKLHLYSILIVDCRERFKYNFCILNLFSVSETINKTLNLNNCKQRERKVI